MFLLRTFVKTIRLVVAAALIWAIGAFAKDELVGEDGLSWWSEVECLASGKNDKQSLEVHADLKLFAADSVLVSLKVLFNGASSRS
ncbi:MAG TPA: hypothetical protein VK017_00205 [Sphingobacterium sp.]|jgi:hypothetical protein|nr:hypothetical protein [Sphingobacterium sp.]